MRRALTRESGPRARVESLLATYVRLAWKHADPYEVMFGRRLNVDGRFPALDAAVQSAVKLLERVVADFIGVEDLRLATHPAMAIWSAAHGYTSMVLRRRIKVRSVKAAEQYICRLAQPLLHGASQPGRPGRMTAPS